MSEEAPDYDAGQKPYAVMRADRPASPVFCATLDEARELAAQRVAQHGGSAWVLRLVGTIEAIASWSPAPDMPDPDHGPPSPTTRPTDAWRVYP